MKMLAGPNLSSILSHKRANRQRVFAKFLLAWVWKTGPLA